MEKLNDRGWRSVDHLDQVGPANQRLQSGQRRVGGLPPSEQSHTPDVGKRSFGRVLD